MTWLSWISHCIIFRMRKETANRHTSSYVVFCSVIFPFYPSKTNTVLEPRTKHFRGLVGFEVKPKDLSFEAKDLKMRPHGHPQGQGRSRALHLSE